MQARCSFRGGFVWPSACLLIRFPLSGLPASLHRRCRRVLFWVQRSSISSPMVVLVAFLVVPFSCFSLCRRSAGSASPPCRKCDATVVLLMVVWRALLYTTGFVASCLFLCVLCVVAGLGGRWRRRRTAFPFSFSWWWSAGLSMLGCCWYRSVEIRRFFDCCFATFVSVLLVAAFVRYFYYVMSCLFVDRRCVFVLCHHLPSVDCFVSCRVVFGDLFLLWMLLERVWCVDALCWR